MGPSGHPFAETLVERCFGGTAPAALRTDVSPIDPENAAFSFDLMADEYQFLTVDARQDPASIQRQLRRMVGDYLKSSGYHVPPELAEISAAASNAAGKGAKRR